MIKSILQFILAVLARATLARFNPRIVGITGSVGKTSTREAVFIILKNKYRVRASEKNYNTEIGLPLTILGISHYGKNIFKWCAAFVHVGVRALFGTGEYPEILILEYGIDKPGDMDDLLAIARPHISAVTAIGDVPVHVEFFKDAEELRQEKAKLVRATRADGSVVLNFDDNAVFDMREETRTPTKTFGFGNDADFKISNIHLRLIKDSEGGDIPDGVSFDIEEGGAVVPVRLHNTFGIPQVLAVAAAAGVARALGMNLVDIANAVTAYVSPPGRMRLLKGIKHSFILDDTYNASPEAMRAALDTLKNLPGARKIAVLGDMLEIGKYTEAAHRAIGDEVASRVDMLITVGARAKFIADEVVQWGFSADAIWRFDDARAAGRALDPMIKEGDLMLIKGSQSMRMERAVLEIMRYPERAGELLVRQEEYWR